MWAQRGKGHIKMLPRVISCLFLELYRCKLKSNIIFELKSFVELEWVYISAYNEWEIAVVFLLYPFPDKRKVDQILNRFL